ncbi:MAG: carboxypeptidase-like regulatory domain-containing protein [Bacteroidales bacterium]|nr:carboxypeptidase-like regulatory domain-containing protein [Bacteroidales bacterium]
MKRIIYLLVAVFFSQQIIAQKNITGKVLDSETNTGLAYANIQVKGSAISVISGADGSFTLPVQVMEDIELTITYLVSNLLNSDIIWQKIQ